MSLSLQDVLDAAVTKPYADKNVSCSQLASIFNAACKFIEETLISKKACNFPNLGLFSLNISKVDLARTEAKASVTPTFVASAQFTQAAQIPAKKHAAKNTLPVVQLNVTRISLETGVAREQVDTALKAVLRVAQEAVRGGGKAAIDIQVGTFLAASDGATVKFNSRFCKLVQELEDVEKPQHLRTTKTLELVPDADTAKALLTRTVPAASHSDRRSAGSAASFSYPAEFTSNGDGLGSRGGSARSAAALATPPSNVNTGPASRPRPKARHTEEHDFQEDADYCDICQSRLAALQEAARARDQERTLEERLRQMAIDKDAADKREAARQAEFARRKRAEIDEFNKPLLNKSREIEKPDSYGDILANRKEQTQIGHIEKSSYREQLAEQMREKERRLKQEAEAEKKAAAEAARRAAEDHKREEQRQWEERRAANLEHKEFLKDQMATKSDFVFELGAAETQFMGNRLVGTAETKQRQRQDAKARADAQLGTIAEKQALRARERDALIAEGDAERRANQDALKLQKKEEELKKLQAQKDAAAALLAQIEENKRRREEEQMHVKGSAAYYAIGDHGDDDHAKNCKECGRTIKDRKPANRQKTQLIPATRAY